MGLSAEEELSVDDRAHQPDRLRVRTEAGRGRLLGKWKVFPVMKHHREAVRAGTIESEAFLTSHQRGKPEPQLVVAIKMTGVSDTLPLVGLEPEPDQTLLIPR